MGYSRRSFVNFLGKSSLGFIVAPYIVGCSSTTTPASQAILSSEEMKRLNDILLQGLLPTDADDLLLSPGLDYEVLIRWGDRISSEDTFGFNNDFTCFVPFDEANPKDGLLWVNHEYVDPLFVSGYNMREKDKAAQERTKEQVDKEMYCVGGSIVRIHEVNGKWEVVEGDPHNRRLTAQTPIKLNWDEDIRGVRSVRGTLANCSGGLTPWNTFLTCEENYDDFFGETIYDEDGQSSHVKSWMGWEQFYEYPPEHYGWVVEIDPLTGEAQKHVALGRFAHECCTLYEMKDRRVVAYTGDDARDEHLYKFVSSSPRSLKEGTLYVADTINGRWLPLDWESQPILKSKFKDQTEVLVRARESAKLLGATELNRPEDIEIDPITGNIFVSLTNNANKGDHHGSIMRIVETDGKFDSLTFEASVFKAGGQENGFSCPDNLAFDSAGNLWITSDMSDSSMNRADKPYMAFKNNSLFVVPRHGKDAGRVIRVASAPRDAELTGPWFSPDGKTLFLSVQHPGAQTRDLNKPTSQWPFDGDNVPKSAVVAIKGDLIEKMNNLHLIEGDS